jgi:hypothetical protein
MFLDRFNMNVEHKTLLSWLAIAHIGAAYKNQEGSLAS